MADDDPGAASAAGDLDEGGVATAPRRGEAVAATGDVDGDRLGGGAEGAGVGGHQGGLFGGPGAKLVVDVDGVERPTAKGRQAQEQGRRVGAAGAGDDQGLTALGHGEARHRLGELVDDVGPGIHRREHSPPTAVGA